jgi:hypothetical protein
MEELGPIRFVASLMRVNPWTFQSRPHGTVAESAPRRPVFLAIPIGAHDI